MSEQTVHEGLEGVVVSETRLSHVDGERGRLVIAGADVEQLAGVRSFEEVSAQLYAAVGLEPVQSAEVAAAMATGRERAFALLPALGRALDLADGMDALRAAVAQLPDTAPRDHVVAALAVFAAAWSRKREGAPPLLPPAGVGHAEALLRMLGRDPSAPRVRALDAYLVTVLEHGFNASAFAARVVASTRADLVSAVVAGIGALKGPLHGGAPGPVLEMLEAIGAPANARAYLERELDAGRRIMGMGHRIYRRRDPRAFVLERAVEELAATVRASDRAADGLLRPRLALARAVEHEAEALLQERYPGRALKANVEFYTAVLLSALDIPSALFSPLFACARAAGWAAHYAEQRAHGRLIRPQARYVGTAPR
jgi:citrate synthase